MFARTITSVGKLLGLGATSVAEEERRAFGRMCCDVETTYRLASRERGHELPARVRNVSRGGLCLQGPGAFHPGELISVRLPECTDHDTSEVLACVVRCDSIPEHRFEIGCTFAAPLDDGDLQRFCGRQPQGDSTDRRDWVRFSCQARAVYQIVRSPDLSNSADSTILNISGGGIALLVTEALTVGDLLSVDLCRNEEVVLTVLASVVRTIVERDGRRIVGCNFIHELPEEQLARLLG
jgi:c-di-GMP-binding flagellar brake protein YcgR